MKHPHRKPPGKVRSIDGKLPAADVVSQDELEHGSEMQLTVWHAEKQCRECIKLLARRIEEGAAIEDGPLAWDIDNEMVRSRKQKAGGE